VSQNAAGVASGSTAEPFTWYVSRHASDDRLVFVEPKEHLKEVLWQVSDKHLFSDLLKLWLGPTT